jgi:hypothetical protein
MAISNIHETLLMYTKQKGMINNQISDVMFKILASSKNVAENQSRYNNKMQAAYFNYYEGDNETYQIVTETLQQDHELELATLNSWETELEIQKNNLETKLNEIVTFESSWTKLLQSNIKNDFTYGGGGGK